MRYTPAAHQRLDSSTEKIGDGVDKYVNKMMKRSEWKINRITIHVLANSYPTAGVDDLQRRTKDE